MMPRDQKLRANHLGLCLHPDRPAPGRGGGYRYLETNRAAAVCPGRRLDLPGVVLDRAAGGEPAGDATAGQ